MGSMKQRRVQAGVARYDEGGAIDALLWASRRHVMSHRLELHDRVRLWQPVSRRARRWWIGGCVAAGVALVSGFTAPQWLHLGQDFDLLTSSLSPDEVRIPVQQGYGQPVHQSVTSHGITLTIGNIYADPLRFEFDMVESFDTSAPSHPVIQDGDIQMDIDGKRPIVGFSGGEFQPADGDRYAGVIYMPMTNMQPFAPLPLHFTLNIHIRRIGEVEGNWDFSIPVSREKMAQATRLIRPHAMASDGQATFSVNEVDLEPNETIVEAALTLPDSGAQPTGDRWFDATGYTAVLITDQNGHRVPGGRIVGWSLTGSQDGQRSCLLTIEAQKLPPNASTLFITPLREQHAGPIQLSSAAPVQAQTPFGPVTVYPPEFLSDRTVVTVDGKFDTYRGQPMQAFTLWWNGADGGMHGCPAPTVNQDGNNPNRWRLVFPKLDAGRQYALGVIHFIPAANLEVQVPVSGR